MKKTKILIFVLALALLVCGAVGIGVSAAEGDASLTIAGKNISFTNEPRLVFAIDSENVTDEIAVWYSEAANMDGYKVATALGELNVNGKSLPCYAIEGVNPKDVAKTFYVQAVAGDVKSAVVKYSVLEWALAGATTTDKAIYDAALAYYGAVQDELGYAEAHVEDYKYVKVTDGTIDGYNTALTTADSVSVVYTGSANPVGWTVTTGGNAVKAGLGTVAITGSCTIEPRFLEPLTVGETFEGGNYTGSQGNGMIIGHYYSAWGTAKTDESVSVVTDPTNPNNKVLAYVDGSTDTGATSIYINNGKFNHGHSVFESKIYIDTTNSTGGDNQTIAQIGFVGGRTSYVSFNLALKTSNGEFAYARLSQNGSSWTNNSSEDIYTLGSSVVPINQWFILRVEYHNTGVADTSYFEFFVNGELIAKTNRTKNVAGDANGFVWMGYSSGLSTIYFDNMSFTETAIPTEE